MTAICYLNFRVCFEISSQIYESNTMIIRWLCSSVVYEHTVYHYDNRRVICRMVVSTVKFILGPDRQWEAERIADFVNYSLKKCKGFIDYKFFVENETGEYISIAYWETRDEALDAYCQVHPRALEMIGSDYQCLPYLQIFEVYKPREYA